MKNLLASLALFFSVSAKADLVPIFPQNSQQYVIKNSTWGNRGSTVTAAQFVAVSTPGFVGNGAGITNISTGALPSSVTLQGNTFNGVNQLVQTGSGGGITIASGTFTASGPVIFSVTSSSSIHVLGGGITFPDGTVIYSSAQFSAAGMGTSTTTTFAQTNFLGQVNGVATSFVLTQTPATSSGVWVYLNGLLQSPTSDYTFVAPQTILMTTAPATLSTQFMAIYAINTSSQSAAALLGLAQTFTAKQTFSAGVAGVYNVAKASNTSDQSVGTSYETLTGSTVTIAGTFAGNNLLLNLHSIVFTGPNASCSSRLVLDNSEIIACGKFYSSDNGAPGQGGCSRVFSAALSSGGSHMVYAQLKGDSTTCTTSGSTFPTTIVAEEVR